MSFQTKKSVVVIGGGLGGVTLAARLASQGFRVTLCEKNEHLGGKMNVLKRNGYSFDTGPSLITLLDIFRETFKSLGSSLEDHVTPLRIDPLAHYVFADGLKLDYSTSLPDMLETIRKIEPRDVDGFLKFMKLGAKIFNLSRETFFNHSPFEFPPQLNARVLKHLPLRYGWGNYARTVQAHFKSPYLQQLFNRYPTYVGSSPYRTPATLIVIPYIEFAYGGWFIKGGLYKIIEALKELAIKNGVTILTNALVSEIIHFNRTIKGARLLDGTILPADVIVMNGDASAIHSLLGKKEESALNLSQRSLSGIVFLVGTSKTMPQLHHHSILFSDSYIEEFYRLFDLHEFPDDPTVYVNAASRSDRSVVPGEGETLFIMANAPESDSIVWDKELIEKTWQAVLKRLQRSGFPEFQSSMLFRDVWTPNNISEKYLMPGGAIYGKNSHGWKNTFLRPPNKDLRYKGLYYVGGSSHPGGGTPMVLLSAKITSRLIQKNETT
jgi:phytoene desaturase